ncbi:MaoC family dehydratase [Promethearchaeum syntrophicum]|uniref:MaoC family dehydratase n=1 Tax=Promethearchaeum syntrophicum TaxID=2594042 RepID=A0A5B9DA04_9ARCH|nr:MaoC family dehydratase [Candidatus Prometheoarchaeum syntrophicum]QEE15396.1 bifunctional enoyl-CoA hydratase/phosphate acetyltransferase [Candidatus Prometheoarchaeum syntrophicum]
MEGMLGKECDVSKTITKADIETFMNLSGDRNPIHHDNEFAKRTFFKKPIAHGLIAASLISAGLTKLMGAGNLWLSQNLEFKKPVYIGDTVIAHLKIIKIDSHKKCKIETIITNQKGNEIITGYAESMLMYVRKPKE